MRCAGVAFRDPPNGFCAIAPPAIIPANLDVVCGNAQRRKIQNAGGKFKLQQFNVREITMYRGSAITAGLLMAALGLLGLSHEAAGQAGNRMVMLTDGTSLNNFDQTGNASWRLAERTIAADRGSGFLVTKQSYGDFRIR